VSNIGDILTGEIAYAYALGEDGCLFSGDGTSTYGGMTGLRKIFNDGVGALAGSVDAASGHDTMAEIDAIDLASVQGKLPQYVYTRASPEVVLLADHVGQRLRAPDWRLGRRHQGPGLGPHRARIQRLSGGNHPGDAGARPPPPPTPPMSP
jgi:hypothetical protein